MPDGEPSEIAARMIEAVNTIHSVEVTRATRDTSADGVSVSAGDAIAVADGTLVAAAGTLEEALLAGLSRVVEGAEVITLFVGENGDGPEAERLIGERTLGPVIGVHTGPGTTGVITVSAAVAS